MEAERTADEVARQYGVSKHTIYAWRAKYGGMEVSEAHEVRQLRDENARLKRLLADLTLDKDALQSVMRENGWSSWPNARRCGGWKRSLLSVSGTPASSWMFRDRLTGIGHAKTTPSSVRS